MIFIDTLWTIQTILKPYVNVKAAGGSASEPKPLSLEDLNNQIELLANEELEGEGTEQLPSVKLAPQPTKTIYEIDTKDEDTTFAIFCLYEDSMAAKLSTITVWSGYRAKLFNLLGVRLPLPKPPSTLSHPSSDSSQTYFHNLHLWRNYWSNF
ncbi:hypothetical protein K469DRAFT_161771 [Zopfia rhizophila CBS 207.26]|uniref:DUF6604 domain-containing protein n=1 Tax=Zopfia rhizophila CBS 207.26 TaxID=1314779 RepID=A0A6A6E4X1_9PEZI|nr:hypothetical protein K469DRAFT_161771 [Zopfia rhizophila CBS 207.26]